MQLEDLDLCSFFALGGMKRNISDRRAVLVVPRAFEHGRDVLCRQSSVMYSVLYTAVPEAQLSIHVFHASYPVSFEDLPQTRRRRRNGASCKISCLLIGCGVQSTPYRPYSWYAVQAKTLLRHRLLRLSILNVLSVRPFCACRVCFCSQL